MDIIDITKSLGDAPCNAAQTSRLHVSWQIIGDTLLVIAFVVAFTFILASCSHIEPRVAIIEPTTAKPDGSNASLLKSAALAGNGAIFQAQGVHRPLFEDMKPRYIGDVLTIAIQERTSASRSSKSSAARASEVTADVPLVRGLPGKSFQGAGLSATGGNTFEGKGETANDNTFSGTITVTVVGVLSNGNLLVAGEKQIGINHNTESIRFSGVVSPVNVQTGNIVASTAVADARLEYRGKGYIDEAQRMGWLQRFFLTFLPV